ncbi:quinon protein alcohol dehydrogenase-like superfamily [Phlyctochytrium arcticum]|nr:quinon protein alcohol dehydrogenase-like superfamily [Phlyctochytrium arcticum]
MLSEIAIVASSTEPTIQIYDLRSGTSLGALKGDKCDRNTLATIPLPVDLSNGGTLLPRGVLAAQNDRALVHYWSLTKGQITQKLVVNEKLTALVTSNNGLYCVGGGASGRLYVWELRTGRLLRAFDGHYKAVRVIRFSSDDRAFASGGEDAAVNIWLMSDITGVAIDSFTQHNQSPSAYVTLSGHSLPITDIHFGSGLFSNARIYTTSLDRTCKLWEAANGTLLATLLFSKPISVMTVDPVETRVLCGVTTGEIFVAELFTQNKATTELRALEQGSLIDGDQGPVFRGHKGAVTSLSLSLDASLLLSGSEDGTAIVWDTSSRQALRTLNSQSSAPVSNVKITLRPSQLLDAGAAKAYQAELKPWARHVSEEIELPESINWQLNSAYNGGDESLGPSRAPQSLENAYLQSISSRAGALLSASGSTSAQSEAFRLRAQLGRLSNQNHALATLSDEFYQAAVGQLMEQVRST